MDSSGALATHPDSGQAHLASAFGSRLLTSPTQLAGIGRDASHYLLEPKAVLKAADAGQVALAMRLAAEHGMGLTFRSGGTSLSGQASSDGLLVDVRQAFRQVNVLAEGLQVACGPGVTVGAVNAALAKYGRMLGPDPASKVAATIGGVVANNASGMACGTQFNTYATLASMEFVLPSGTTVDSAAVDADDRLRQSEPALYAGLAALRDQVRADPVAMAKIAAQYAMKNTMGYGINSLVDFDRPVDILTHLMIGSEGTLGFVAGATFNTVEVPRHVATALLVFPHLEAATDALAQLLAAGAKVLELMDPTSVAAAQAAAAPGDPILDFHGPGQTALLVELRSGQGEELAQNLADMRALLPKLGLVRPSSFAIETKDRALLWASRNGLYTAVAGARPPGTTALLEDIAVPVSALSGTCHHLAQLFRQNELADGVIFGHAKDGNIHFMVTLDLAQAVQLRRFEAFTDQMVDLVLDAGGTLKAEHGTGRIMAPFVRRQFGDRLYEVMGRIKQLCDPGGLLGPGVVINADARAHLNHIKVTPVLDEAFDRCVECGYCEPTCASRDLTTTPRQRIALLRQIATLPPDQAEAMARDFDYQGVDTCAADSLCLVACPVNIDTGHIIEAMRVERHSSPVVQLLGRLAARHWRAVVALLRLGLHLAGVLPSRLLQAVTRAARRVLPQDWIPQVGQDLPRPGPPRRRSRQPHQSRQSELWHDAKAQPRGIGADQRSVSAKTSPPELRGGAGIVVRDWLRAFVFGNAKALPQDKARDNAPGPAPAFLAEAQPGELGVWHEPEDRHEAAVFFSTCINSLFAPSGAGPGVGGALRQLAAMAGVELIMPEHIEDLCCGTVWQSKGLVSGQREMARRVFGVLWRASGQGRWPVVADAASCTKTLTSLPAALPVAQAELAQRLKVIDATSYVRKHLASRLVVPQPLAAIAVHPTCSTVHLGAVDDLVALAEMAAETVFVPPTWGCCGFAGDRGMLHPELTASATGPEAQAIAQAEAERAKAAGGIGQFDAYVTANRTCEIGISRATGRTYRHVLEVLAEVARPGW
ncbi:MAG: FAD-binding oxidoreductase [Micrococcales bacterium]|nr:FAD-binding oxidoreductase [Micrococcales bacterium]